jgi:hypothetical protein
MLDCGISIDKWSLFGIVVMLFCIIAMVYIISGQLSQQTLALAHELDTIHKKLNGILGIIGLVAEEGRDLIETERAKHVQTTVPAAEELIVEEVKFVDEEAKPVDASAGPAIPIEEVEKTFEAEEVVF